MLKRETVLVFFMAITILNSLLAGIRGNTSDTWTVSVLAVFVYGTLAYFTFQRQLIATWGLITIMLFYGSGFVYDALATVVLSEAGSIALNTLQLLAGMYVFWGVLVIFKSRHERT